MADLPTPIVRPNGEEFYPVTPAAKPAVRRCDVVDTLRRAPGAALHHPIDPLNTFAWYRCSDLSANDYNPNVVLTPELRLLERSILKSGWVQPVIAAPSLIIIDGFHRFMLSKDPAGQLYVRYGGWLPVVILDVSDGEAMLLTIRMNRAKGTHVALRMSAIVRKLIDVHHMDPQQIMAEMGATREEVDLLYQEDVFKAKNIAGYVYSKAWEPREDGRKNGQK